MSILIKIAWRNIWRNPARSSLIIGAITVGLVAGNFISAASVGWMNQAFEDTIERRISHIQLHDPEFIAEGEARHRIENGFAIVQELQGHPAVKAAAGRTVLDGMVASPHLSAGVKINGINREWEMKTTGSHEQIERGTFFTDTGRLPSVVIGEALADKLRADTGSRIVLTFQDVEGEMISASFRIEGIFISSSTVYEERMIFVQTQEINELIGDADAVTEIAVLLHEYDTYLAITEELKHAYPGLTVRNWENIAPELALQLRLTEQSLLWMITIFLFAVGFGLLNTILMSVLERTRELGMLMAVGMKKANVFGMVILETVMLSLTGGIVGLVISFGLVRYLNSIGIDLSAVGGENLREFGFSPVVYPDLEIMFYFKVAMLVVMFAILAALYPAVKAVKLVPAEAVRQE